MLTRIAPAPALALAWAVALAAPALGSTASDYQAVLHAYQSTGTVPACRFTPAQLERALEGVDAYGAQYFADFTQAVGNAISVRAAGSCAAGDTGTGATGGPAVDSTGGATGLAGAVAAVPGSSGRAGTAPLPPARFPALTAATGAGVPAPLAIMGVLTLAGALAAAGAGIRRLRGRPRPHAHG